MRRVRGNSGFLRATKLSTPLLHPGSAFNRSFLLAELRMYLHLHIYPVSLYIQLQGSRFVLVSSPWRFVNLLHPSFLPLFFYSLSSPSGLAASTRDDLRSPRYFDSTVQRVSTKLSSRVRPVVEISKDGRVARMGEDYRFVRVRKTIERWKKN